MKIQFRIINKGKGVLNITPVNLHRVAQPDLTPYAKTTYVDAKDLLKEDKANKGLANGYAPLDATIKIASQYLSIVNDLLTGGETSLLSAEQGKRLSLEIATINGILFSDNVNLDTVQEIVDAIESIQSYLDTILVNDLTTGGVTKAATAETVKVLKALIDNIGTSLATVATTGSYNDLLDKPSIRSVQNEYANIPALKADQANQSQGAFQAVIDASDDPSVGSGYAYYEFLGTTTAAMSDYRKLSEQESMDLVPITKTSQLENDGSTGASPFVEQVGFNNAMALKVNTLKTIVPQPNTTKTLALEDLNKAIKNTNIASTTVTIPTNASVPLPTGFEVDVISEGTGVVTIATTGLTIISDLQSMVMAIGETRTLLKTDTNTWSVKGKNPEKGTGTSNTFFIDKINGTNGVINDTSKPFPTLAAAIAAMPVDNESYVNIYFLSNGTHLGCPLPDRNINWYANASGTTIDFTGINTEPLSGTVTTWVVANTKSCTYNFPTGNITLLSSNGTVQQHFCSNRVSFKGVIDLIQLDCLNSSDGNNGIVLYFGPNTDVRIKALNARSRNANANPFQLASNAVVTIDRLEFIKVTYDFRMFGGGNQQLIINSLILTSNPLVVFQDTVSNKSLRTFKNSITGTGFISQLGGGCTFVDCGVATGIAFYVPGSYFSGNIISSHAVLIAAGWGQYTTTFENFTGRVGTININVATAGFIFKGVNKIKTAGTFLNASTSLVDAIVIENGITTIETDSPSTILCSNASAKNLKVSGKFVTNSSNLGIKVVNTNIDLPTLPNTFSSGQLPSNKVLSTDSLGNLGLYSIATAPAPYIQELIPDSYLPSTTGNIRILGSFFTPAMCDRVNNPNAIVIGGVSTINYATFKSSNEILVNVTTGAAEGSFPITMNNGLSTTKNNAFLIVLGTVYVPKLEDWTDIVGQINLYEKGFAKTLVANSVGTAKYGNIPPSINISIRFNFQSSPLVVPTSNSQDAPYYSVTLYDKVTGFDTFKFVCYANPAGQYALNVFMNSSGRYWKDYYGVTNAVLDDSVELRRLANVSYLYYRGTLIYTWNDVVNNDQGIKVRVAKLDVGNIKYIELA